MKKIFICIVFMLSFSGLNKLASQTIYPDYIDGQLYLQFIDSYNPTFVVDKDKNINITEFPFLVELAVEYGITNIKKPFYLVNTPQFKRVIQIEFDSITRVDSLQAVLERYNFVKTIFKEAIPTQFSVPNDPYYTQDYNGSGYNFRWHLDMINAEKAWETVKGNPQIKVAIIDNAIWGEHPDLQIPGNLQYNAAQGTVGNSSPPDSIAQEVSQTSFSWSHGTHCAGLVGAISNNSEGVASLGSGLTLMGISIQNTWMRRVRESLEYAIENGADVVNMSFGSPENLVNPIEKAYYQVLADSIVMVASAGNSDTTIKNYPAATIGAISVGSVDSDGRLSVFSQYGSWIKIAAPGGINVLNGDRTPIDSRAILSTTYSKTINNTFTGHIPPNVLMNVNYDLMMGTSMSSPIVAGLCGLMLSKNPYLSPKQILEYLQATATPIVPDLLNADKKIGSGYINADSAIKAVCEYMPTAKFSANTTSIVAGGDIDFVDESLPGHDAVITQKSWYFPGSTTATEITNGQRVTYNNAGVYDMALVVANDKITVDKRGVSHNNADSLAKNNYINVQLPMGTDTLYANVDTVVVGAYRNNLATFTIIANEQNWKIENECYWTSLRKIDSLDKTGNAVFTIGVDGQNMKATSRTGVFRIIKGTDTVDVILKQAPANTVLKVSKSVISLKYNTGSSTALSIASTLDWAFETSSIPEWLTVTPLTGSLNKTAYITPNSANKTYYTRTANIRLKGGDIEKVITVTQAPQPCVLTFDKDTLLLDNKQGSSETVKLTTACHWNILQPLPDFVAADKLEGYLEDSVVVFTTTQNNENETRTEGRVTFLFSEDTTTSKILVIQQKSVLGIEKESLNANKWLVYPNPVSNILVIEGASSFAKLYQVMDISGRMLIEKNPAERTEVDMSKLAKGTYILRIIAKDGTQYTQKLIKQ